MPCTVKCRCGKASKTFNRLNPGDIESFDCGKCGPEQPKAEKADQPAPEAPAPIMGLSKNRKKKDQEQAQKPE